MLAGLAEAYTDDGKYNIRALNVTWVPELIRGEVAVALRSDGRFGKEDYLHWPQCYCPEKEYLSLIPRHPKHLDHPAQILWQVPQAADFE